MHRPRRGRAIPVREARASAPTERYAHFARGLRSRIRRTRNLVALDLLLLAASVPGVLNVVAKDRVSTTEGVLACVSAVAFVVAAGGLVVILVRRLRRS